MSKASFLPKIASRCETCHGAGILPGRCREDELLPCPTCKGKGVIPRKITKKHVEERRCDNPNCKDGRVQQLTMVDGREVMTEKVCPVCDGYGVIYSETQVITTQSEKCPTCNGAAVITAGEMRHRKLEGFCPECHGTGYKFEKKPLARAARFGTGAVLFPSLTLVGTSFSLMCKGVKAAIFTKTPKQKEEQTVNH